MKPPIDVALLQTEFTAAFLRVWSTAVGAALEPTEINDMPQDNVMWAAGVVWIGGQWTGSVTIAFPQELARKVTAKMLQIDVRQVTELAYQDVVRELANMSAGNLKSALPGPCGLATPGYFEVWDPACFQDAFHRVVSLFYWCEDFPVVAELRSLN